MADAASNLVDPLLYACKLAVYCRLSSSSELSNEDTEKLALIYQEAETDPLLDSLINDADFLINEKIGFFGAEHDDDYRNQQSWLREHLEEIPLDYESRIEMQEFLHENKYYQGPIDGVLGSRSKEAIKKFHHHVQKMLAENGFYHEDLDGKIDEEFEEYSVSAVKRFQQEKRIEGDGVPGKETFSKLQQLELGKVNGF